MADNAVPFTAFNFDVEIDVPGISPKICDAVFSECDGLEATMDVKTIREGGNNSRQIRLIGAASYGTVTLKRGLTASSIDLLDWFAAQQEARAADLRQTLRGTTKIVYRAANHAVAMVVTLDRCLLTKLKAPPLSGKDGAVAIEELQLVYETLSYEPGVANG